MLDIVNFSGGKWVRGTNTQSPSPPDERTSQRPPASKLGPRGSFGWSLRSQNKMATAVPKIIDPTAPCTPCSPCSPLKAPESCVRPNFPRFHPARLNLGICLAVRGLRRPKNQPAEGRGWGCA